MSKINDSLYDLADERNNKKGLIHSGAKLCGCRRKSDRNIPTYLNCQIRVVGVFENTVEARFSQKLRNTLSSTLYVIVNERERDFIEPDCKILHIHIPKIVINLRGQ